MGPGWWPGPQIGLWVVVYYIDNREPQNNKEPEIVYIYNKEPQKHSVGHYEGTILALRAERTAGVKAELKAKEE